MKWRPHIRMHKGWYRVFWRYSIDGCIYAADMAPYKERLAQTKAAIEFVVRLNKALAPHWKCGISYTDWLLRMNDEPALMPKELQ